MSNIINILIAVVVFSVVIIFHELGHFLLAKKNGIGVTEFSLGMGPRLWSRKKGETRYSLKLFPIGGSCMMLGEDEELSSENAFNNKSVWARLAVIAAGPIFNFILAFILSLVIVSIYGYDKAAVTSVDEGSSAYEQGLKEGDIITSINGTNIDLGREVALYFTFNTVKPGDVLHITYERDGKEYEADITCETYKRYLLGFSYMPDKTAAEVLSITMGGAMDNAGIVVGDIITSINGNEITCGEDIYNINMGAGFTSAETEVKYMRNGIEYTTVITPTEYTGTTIGFSYNSSVCENTNALNVIKYSFIEVKYWISSTLKSLGWLVTGKLGADDLGGPVRIVSEIGKVVDNSQKYGIVNVIVNLLNWAVLLSANLGVMNLIPIPALDGGRILFLLYEAIKKKPIDRNKEAYINMIGFALLMVLMIFVFFNDLKHIF